MKNATKETPKDNEKSFNVLLFGETGSGKTTFLSALALSLPNDCIESDHYLRSLAERLRHEESVEATRRQEDMIQFKVIDPRTNQNLSVTIDDQVGEDCRKFASFHVHDQTVTATSEPNKLYEELDKVKKSIHKCDAVIILVNLYSFFLLERHQPGRWFQSNAWFLNILKYLQE